MYKYQIIENFNKLNEVPNPKARNNADFNENTGKITAKTMATDITNILILTAIIFFIPYNSPASIYLLLFQYYKSNLTYVN